MTKAGADRLPVNRGWALGERSAPHELSALRVVLWRSVPSTPAQAACADAQEQRHETAQCGVGGA